MDNIRRVIESKIKEHFDIKTIEPSYESKIDLAVKIVEEIDKTEITCTDIELRAKDIVVVLNHEPEDENNTIMPILEFNSSGLRPSIIKGRRKYEWNDKKYKWNSKEDDLWKHFVDAAKYHYGLNRSGQYKWLLYNRSGLELQGKIVKPSNELKKCTESLLPGLDGSSILAYNYFRCDVKGAIKRLNPYQIMKDSINQDASLLERRMRRAIIQLSQDQRKKNNWIDELLFIPDHLYLICEDNEFDKEKSYTLSIIREAKSNSPKRIKHWESLETILETAKKDLIEIGNCEEDVESIRIDDNRVISYSLRKAGKEPVTEYVRVKVIREEEREEAGNYNAWLKNECISFCSKDSKSISDLEKMREKDYEISFKLDMLYYLKEILEKEGYKDVSDENIKIDINGIIEYKAILPIDYEELEITGHLGQVFAPEGNKKLIKTKYLSDHTNYWFVPEFKAYLLPIDDERRTLEERTVLHGYADSLKNAIRTEIENSTIKCVMGAMEGVNSPETIVHYLQNCQNTNLNWRYSKLYEERFHYDFLSTKCDECNCALPFDIREAIVNTLANKVKYADKYMHYELNRLVPKYDKEALELLKPNTNKRFEDKLKWINDNHHTLKEITKEDWERIKDKTLEELKNDDVFNSMKKGEFILLAGDEKTKKADLRNKIGLSVIGYSEKDGDETKKALLRVDFDISELDIKKREVVNSIDSLQEYIIDQFEKAKEESCICLSFEGDLENMSAKARETVDKIYGLRIVDDREWEDGDKYYYDVVLHKSTSNLYIIEKREGKAYFDPEATSAGTKQGSIRYLVAGAKVGEDGHIIPNQDNPDARTPIFEHDFLNKYSKYNPFDRNQMVFSNLMRAYSITEPVQTALMTCGGWNMEDGFVVSREFADEYKVPDKNGILRPLKIGDKMLDRGGNKGVIAIIVDRKANINEDDDPLLFKLQKVFKDNDKLDVIASPYSGLSRFNGATARELMEHPRKLMDGKESKGMIIGEAQYIITRQFADKKTKIYSHEDYLANKSRKASPQLSWALCSKDAKHMLKYLYGSGERARIDTVDARAIVDLNDVNPIGDYFSMGSERKDYILAYRQSNKYRIRGYDEPIDQYDFINKILDYDEPVWYAYQPANASSAHRYIVLPKHLRAGYVNDLGKTIEDEITRKYRNLLNKTDINEIDKIYNEIQSFIRKKYVLDRIKPYSKSVDSDSNIDDKSEDQELDDVIAGVIDEQPNDDQANDDSPENNSLDVEKGHVIKDNMFKSIIMTRAVDHSATAIWTPDPRLSIGSVALSTDIANALKINIDNGKEDYVLIWRDPVLRDAGVRYMKVAKIDDDLTGIAINPVVAKGFDGDFDGDTVAVVNLCPGKNQEDVDIENIAYKAHKEALEKFTVDNNLFDEGKTGKQLILNTKQDLVSSGADLSGKTKIKEIDDELKNAFAKDYVLDNALIRLDSEVSIISSLTAISESGAKGGSIFNYKTYFEQTYTDEERRKVQTATAIKAAVGVAGRYSQQLMRIFREKCPKAALELTYPNTQALLQIKHDPGKAKIVYKCLRDDLMKAWKKPYSTIEEGVEALYKTYSETLEQKLVKKEYFTEVFDNTKPIEKEVKVGEEKVKTPYYSVINCANYGSMLDEFAYSNGYKEIKYIRSVFDCKENGYTKFFIYQDESDDVKSDGN